MTLKEVVWSKIEYTVDQVLDEEEKKKYGQMLKRWAVEAGELEFADTQGALNQIASDLGVKRAPNKKVASKKKAGKRKARKPKDEPDTEPEKASLVGTETGEKPSPPPLPLASAEPPKGPMDDNDDSEDITIEQLAERGAQIESVSKVGLTPPPEPEDTGFSESE